MKFIISKSKRKSISLKIINETTIKVNAPLNYNDIKIEEFINSKKGWILNKTNQIKVNKSKYLSVLEGDNVCLFGEFFNFTGDKRAYLQKIATEYLVLRTNQLASIYNLTFNTVKIKNYKSKWGQCDKFKNITLNYKLIMLDKRVIDYVIMHELCHTLYFNHQKNFHTLLSSYFEDEKFLIKKLKEGAVLINY